MLHGWNKNDMKDIPVLLFLWWEGIDKMQENKTLTKIIAHVYSSHTFCFGLQTRYM